MFDIDGTLFDYSLQPIKPIIDLLFLAYSYIYIIIIITARPEDSTTVTKQLLDSESLPYDYLFLRKSSDDLNTFKSEIKQSLKINNKIEIVLSVGNNWIDVNGSYSGHYIKLANEKDSTIYYS